MLTTHYLEEAEELADRVGVIDHGKLLLLEEKVALMQRLGHRQLVVTFDTPLTQMPAGVEGTLSAEGRALHFVERAGTATAAQVLQALYGAQLPIRQVEIQQAKLEDIMLRVLKGQVQA